MRDTPEFLNDAEIHAGSAPKAVPETEKHIRWVGDVLWIGDLLFAILEYTDGAYKIRLLDMLDLKLSLLPYLPQNSDRARETAFILATNFVRAAALAGMVRS